MRSSGGRAISRPPKLSVAANQPKNSEEDQNYNERRDPACECDAQICARLESLRSSLIFLCCCHHSVLGCTSRSFLGASARSIARSASATASDLMAVRPPTETPVSSETDHFHTGRPMPWTTVYSTPRYFMSLRIGAVFLHPGWASFRDPHPAGSR